MKDKMLHFESPVRATLFGTERGHDDVVPVELAGERHGHAVQRAVILLGVVLAKRL
jgi:hypothetical protein